MRRFLVVAAFIGMTSCATQPEPANTLAVGNYIEKSLAYVEKEKSYANRYPGAIEGFTRNSVRLYPQNTAADLDLLQPVNGRWNGTLDDLTKSAAKLAGYSTRAEGERSGSPIFVTVEWDGLPLLGVLREAFGQGKGRAWLEIDQVAKVMTVHYARKERSPVPHLDDTEL